MNPDEINSMIGKTLLVGITRINKEKKAISQEQYHGTILRMNKKEGLVISRSDNGEEFHLPPDIEHYKLAAPGIYRLKASGEEIVDPDYIGTWDINLKN